MKMIFTLLTSFFLTVAAFAQTPQSFNYQAVARDGSGNVLANKPIGLQLSILDGTATGAVLYAETFSISTNDLGLFTLGVGTGSAVSGSFSAITWASGSKYLKTELDPTGGTHYTLTGTAQLLSVPYALYANAAGSSANSPWTTSGTAIFNSNSGDVGIGIGTNPLQNTLQIGDPPAFSGNTLAMGNGTQGMSFAFANSTSTWFTNNNFSLMPAFSGTGYLGIGTSAPTNQVQIGATPDFIGNNLAMGNGTQAMSFFQGTTASTWFTNNSFSLMPAFGGNGNVGIGINPSTTVKLEIQPASLGTGIFVAGSTIRTAFEAQSGDFFIDGGNASISGNTSITGDLTIGGSDASTAALVVQASNNQTPPPAGSKSLTNCSGFCGTGIRAIDASSGDVWANAFYALSDQRVKNIIGFSDPAHDLALLNSIRITDYTMKDTRAHGDRRFKKVIAQQVEKVYPQVIETGKGYIPNVYQATSKIEKTDNGYLLSFANPHGISKTAAKIQLTAKGSTRPYDILSIPSDRQVLIKASAINGDTVFVYGEQVNDLHTVDYEGLTTLNISATQELSILVQQQEKMIAVLKDRISQLETSVKNKNRSSVQRLPEGK